MLQVNWEAVRRWLDLRGGGVLNKRGAVNARCICGCPDLEAHGLVALLDPVDDQSAQRPLLGFICSQCGRLTLVDGFFTRHETGQLVDVITPGLRVVPPDEPLDLDYL